MTAPEAAGERFIAASDWVWMDDVSPVLRSELGADAKKVPTRGVPDFVLRIVGMFDRQMQFITPLYFRLQDALQPRPEGVAEDVLVERALEGRFALDLLDRRADRLAARRVRVDDGLDHRHVDQVIG